MILDQRTVLARMVGVSLNHRVHRRYVPRILPARLALVLHLLVVGVKAHLLVQLVMPTDHQTDFVLHGITLLVNVQDILVITLPGLSVESLDL